MEKRTKYDDSIDFVAKHYKASAFSTDKAWAKIGVDSGGSNNLSWWQRYRAVVAIAAFAILTASACVYMWITPHIHSNDTEQENSTQDMEQTLIDVDRIYVIEVADAPLSDVIAEIEQAYSVEIGNIPEEDYRLTLRYEGTASDLIDTINNLLNINLIITE